MPGIDFLTKNHSMKLHISILFTGLFLTYIPSIAQFKEGEIRTSAGEIRSGLIDIDVWGRNGKRIRFKDSESGKPRIMTTDELSGFTYSGTVFSKEIVEIETSLNTTKEMSVSPEFQIETDTVFLQEVIGGSVPLFCFISSTGKYQYYIKNADAYELLLFKTYKVQQSGNDILKNNNRYIGQLNIYFSGCSDLREVLKGVEYKRKSLAKAIQRYYDCVGEEFMEKEIELQNKIELDVGLLAGATLTNINFSFNQFSTDFEHLTQVDYDTHVSFTGGAFVEIGLQSTPMISIYSELSYGYMAFESTYQAEFFPLNSYETEFSFDYLRFVLAPKINIQLSNAELYAIVGLSLYNKLSETNINRIDPEFGDPSEEPAIEATNKRNAAMILALGIRMKRIGFQIRMEPGLEVAHILANDRVDRTSFLLSYQLNQPK
jgi:hypothetical protein